MKSYEDKGPSHEIINVNKIFFTDSSRPQARLPSP